MDLSATLKAMRMQRGFKQEQIASALGISRSTYTNFENGREPSLSFLCKLADLYGMSLDELVGHTVIQHSIDDSEEDYILNEGEKIRDTWRQRIKKRKTVDMLLYFLYLLNIVEDDVLLKYAEELLQMVMEYIIRNLCWEMMQKEAYPSKEGFRLSTRTSNRLLDICTELEAKPAKKCLQKMGKINMEFSILELTDPKTVKKYFYVNLDEILQQK